MSSLPHLLVGYANICRLSYGTGVPIFLSTEEENKELHQLQEGDRM